MSIEATRPEGQYTMGHVSLHYPKKDDGPIAAKLLSLMGFVETQCIPFPGGNFYRFVVDQRHHARGDGIVYLSVLPEAQQTLLAAVRNALHLGTKDEHPAIAGVRAALDADPEYTFHLGVLADSLERLEAVVLDLQERADSDPDFKGRISIKLNRAALGSHDVDARLDASPVYGGVTRYAYGRNGVQAFFRNRHTHHRHSDRKYGP